jgi:DNA topoisomerase-1
MTKLLIVESPAKAKTISKYLDGKYKVVASVGHVRDLPKSNKKAIDIEAGFVPHYEISKGKDKVVDEIASLAKNAEEILLATDPDREGEAIAWHVAQATGMKNPKRVVFHEITEEAVKEAILHPRKIDMNLKEAQEARRVLEIESLEPRVRNEMILETVEQVRRADYYRNLSLKIAEWYDE